MTFGSAQKTSSPPYEPGPRLMSELLERIELLNEIGIALSVETDTPKLLELIVTGAKSLTHADGCSLYFLQDGKLGFEIMSFLRNENRIDPDIFDVFIKNRVYLDYATEFLDPEQIDRIDESMIPGYST